MGYDPELIERVRQLNVIDDVLFQKMAEDKDFCSELISTILEKPVRVIETIPQNAIKNLQGRSVIVDALCRVQGNRLVNVEVQKADDDNHLKRMRYNSSCITANIMEPGERFEKVPNVCSIMISKFDLFGGNQTVYHVERLIKETGEQGENGHTEIYVNTKVDDGSAIAKLMHIFTEKDTYDFEKFPNCSKRKQQFRMEEEGEGIMCEIIDEYVNKKVKEAKEAAEREACKAKEAAEREACKAKEAAEREARKAKEAAEREAREAKEGAIGRMLKCEYSIGDILEIYPDMNEDGIQKIKDRLRE